MSFDVRATDEVEHFGDGAEGLILSVLVFVNDELVSAFEGHFTDEVWRAGFVAFDNGVKKVEESCMRVVYVAWSDVVSLGWPINLVVVLSV